MWQRWCLFVYDHLIKRIINVFLIFFWCLWAVCIHGRDSQCYRLKIRLYSSIFLREKFCWSAWILQRDLIDTYCSLFNWLYNKYRDYLTTWIIMWKKENKIINNTVETLTTRQPSLFYPNDLQKLLFFFWKQLWKKNYK